MVEINTSAYRDQQLWKNNPGAPVQFLLVPERAQVLDLLIHLISNSTDSILLCGPEGVGKSKLLKVLQSYEIPACIFCLIEGYPELTLEEIQQQLDKSLNLDKADKYDRTLASAHTERGPLHKKSVLIIDNAGFLAPGLITAIIHYAAENPRLRVIFVLTHDQLHLKYRSDQIIEDCHIVELPPLTEKQCGEFLQHLSGKSSAGVSAEAIEKNRISTIYRQTHGIPARIISEYSVLPQRKHSDNSTGILVIAVSALIVVALSVQWFSSRQPVAEKKLPEKKSPAEAPVKSPDIDLDLPYLTFPGLEPEGKQSNNYLQFDNSKKANRESDAVSGTVLTDSSRKTEEAAPSAEITQGQTEDLKPNKANQSGLENSDLTEASTQPPQQVPPAEETLDDSAAAEDDSSVWLSSQPGNHYTLQLMVLSKRQSIQDVMKKYPSLQQNFRYVRRMSQNKEKFILLYGSFSDALSANKAKKTLPAEFQKAMARKIGAIQKEFGLLSENR
ncbi:MAG: AAA family ATPase [Methylosarcina sp.]